LAEEEEAAPRPAAAAPQPGLLRYLPIILLVLVAQAGGAYFLLDRLRNAPEEGVTKAQDDEGRPRVEVPEDAVPETSVELKDIVVNPRGTKARYLVTADVTLGAWPSGASSEINSDINVDRVRDAVIAALSSATPTMLATMDGRQEVKRDIMERVNIHLYEGKVVDVYFGKFLQQAMAGYQQE